ncbi:MULTISPECIES: hypothetical protein [unclassified Paenibacillus]|uniref:ATP-dependent DNA ligase n=2 Tax=Paenibacillus TaxID=44249 RepID=UPI000425B243|nr:MULTISPECIES: hypothetical protein [unclassified Paenibacillus]KKC48695.1 hypothetical protein VE23_19015 [Paenibacillus sp. D9]
MKPFVPMSPILTDSLPAGGEWAYQLKWDGFRIISVLRSGEASLWSKKMKPRTESYPDLAHALEDRAAEGFPDLMLDGEAFLLDPHTAKPSFQMMQGRDKLRGRERIERASRRQPVGYLIFDLLQVGREDLRSLPFEERSARLKKLCSSWQPPFFLADMYEDGESLWRWAEENGWEGVVAKRRGSRYSEGKEHGDWYKRKTFFHREVDIVALLYKEGKLSSLVMSGQGRYMGRISSGLNERAKRQLSMQKTMSGRQGEFGGSLPEGLRGTDIRWLASPIAAGVSGRELTQSGLLRHPKLEWLEGIVL